MSLEKAKNQEGSADILDVGGEAVPNGIPKESCAETDKAFYEYTAHQIEREDGLVNFRLTWMLTTQGFLFTALALISEKSRVSSETYDLLIDLLPITGLFLSLVGLFGVAAAYASIYDLKTNLKKKLTGSNFPRPHGGTKAFWFGASPSILVPIALGIIWLLILVKL